MEETKEKNLLVVAITGIVIGITSLAIFYILLKSLIKPTKKNKRKVQTSSNTPKLTKSPVTDASSSAQNSSITIDLSASEME